MLEGRVKRAIAALYKGDGRAAARFRYGLLAFDFSTIAFFIVTAPMELTPAILAADIAIGSLILLDFLLRLWIAEHKRRMLLRPYTLADLLVIASLLLAPIVDQNLTFLRLLRALRLLHSYEVLRDLRQGAGFFRRHEDVIVRSVNLLVFVFIVTGVVFSYAFGRNADIDSYVAALYFTVSSLTTTGFGDIVLHGTAGRLLSVLIMVVGVALFIRLAQAMFAPAKVIHTCPDCGLDRHEPDAVHCKHCGRTLKITTHGEQ
ncbi:MAG: potassium channel family protein [Tistlia sp.]|uniref:ion channel n=1 Tax=Tistlia sp. TaxID=3057121 RepID=UPI0034A48AAF